MTASTVTPGGTTSKGPRNFWLRAFHLDRSRRRPELPPAPTEDGPSDPRRWKAGSPAAFRLMRNHRRRHRVGELLTTAALLLRMREACILIVASMSVLDDLLSVVPLPVHAPSMGRRTEVEEELMWAIAGVWAVSLAVSVYLCADGAAARRPLQDFAVNYLEMAGDERVRSLCDLPVLFRDSLNKVSVPTTSWAPAHLDRAQEKEDGSLSPVVSVSGQRTPAVRNCSGVRTEALLT
ncbi:probable G-protein coupled receptor 149 [Lates japonicus]|uniref:Probable G-protein coupled receptor 149 n=1 Tax=Lates japonicus TaxID=270547 RepID=A0AAD3MF88_LATJO|nr:probable G-protein coupled receptor 149 [Lates japonicus]